MDKQEKKIQHSYLPISWDFREVLQEQMAQNRQGKIFYFDEEDRLEETVGSIARLIDVKGEGEFILLNTGLRIRLDRIITLFGKIGSAYEEYDAYSIACTTCLGGHTKEELNDQ